MNNELREILLCFYNGVHGNIDIKHGYPPIHMKEALDRLEALISTQIQEARIEELGWAKTASVWNIEHRINDLTAQFNSKDKEL